MGVHLQQGGVKRRRSGVSAGRRRRHAALMGEINVTPMVDVMLVLLIVFMVAAPLMVSGVTVDLPEAKSDVLPGKDEPLNISVKKSGEIFINSNKESLKLSELVPKLSAITEVKLKKETRIFISGDKGVDYGRMVKVLAAISQAGYTKISLITEPDNG